MPTNTDSIVPIGLLQRKHDGGYELVVRWVLGAKGDNLPRADDSFRLTVRRTKKDDLVGDPAADYFLDPVTKRFDPAPGNKHEIEVAPQNYAMIDPPRTPYAFPPDEKTHVWDIAVEPKKPIEAICPLSHGKLPAGEGFGVYHLLCESQKSRAEWRAARALFKPAMVVVDDVVAMTPALKKFKGSEKYLGGVVASQIAHTMVRNGLYAKNVTLSLKKAYEELLRGNVSQASIHIFTPNRAWLAGAKAIAPDVADAIPWLYAEVVAEVLKVPAVRYELEAIIDQRKRLREQLRLRAFQGGKLLDFWCSPRLSAAKCTAGTRGRQYAQSDLLGLGRSIGNFTKAELTAWVAAREAILLTVEQTTDENTKALINTEDAEAHHSDDLKVAGKSILDSVERKDGEAGDFLLLEKGEDAPFNPGSYRIEPKPKGGRQSSIQKAIDSKSSMPPNAPMGASVNYDLVQANVGKEDVERDSEGQLTQQLDYVTGDGRVQIQIEHPADNPDLNIAGFNVYAMWECDATASYFVSETNPGSVSVAEIRKWRVTRRYSFERDLKGAFPGLFSKLPLNPDGFDSDQLIDPPSYEVDPVPPGYTTDPEIRAIVDPPSQPVILRPETVYDLHEKAKEDYEQSFGAEPKEDNVAMPDKTKVGVTQYDLDIRLGIDSGVETQSWSAGQQYPVFSGTRRFVGWDTQFHAKTSWTPKQKRNGEEAKPRPQRYRFWVTAVDAFEQESDPVPVRTNDEATGETQACYLFGPKYRAALQPPPATEPRQIEFAGGPDGGSGPFQLKIVWHTPYLSEVGKYGNSAVGERAPREDVRANVILFRKRLKPDSEQRAKELSLLTGSLPGEFDVPQWRNAIKRWISLDWEAVKTWENVDGGVGAKPDDPWELPWTGQHVDRGHEYVALIGAFIRDAPSVRSFWTADAKKISLKPQSGRRVQLLDCDGSDDPKYTLRFEYIDELPTSSEVAETATFPVANVQPSRSVELRDNLEFVRAKPILSPPSVFRDLLLMKLLAHPVKRVDAIEPMIPWGPKSVPLTYAQKAMLEAALDRAVGEREDILPYLDDAKQLLAEDLVSGNSEDSNPNFRQHASIGFRGLQELAFSYTPSLVSPLKQSESEAELISVYSVRVTLADPASGTTDAAKRNYSSCEVSAEFLSQADDVLAYRLTEIPDPDSKTSDVLGAIRSGRTPALALVSPLSIKGEEGGDTDGTHEFAGNPVAVSDDTRPIIKLRVPADELPATPPPAVVIRLFQSEILLEEEIEKHDAKSSFRTYVRVGGGPRQIFAWWIGTSSAKGVTSGLGNTPFVVRRFNPTIMPNAPQQFSALPPLKGPKYFLDPRKYSEWVPTSLKTPEQAVTLPRLVLSWDYSDTASATYMLIERRQRRIEKEDVRLESLGTSISPWEAIKAIEALPELGEDSKPAFLQASWIDAIRDNWLKGEIVDIEGQVPELRPLIGFPFDHATLPHNSSPLSASQGLGKDVGDGTRPAFIDYFQHLGDLTDVMDANFEYSYRAMSFIDLGAQAFENKELADSQNWRWRYLMSYPTPWTGYRPPETSPIAVVVESPSQQPTNNVGPIVSLDFTTASAKTKRKRSVAETEEWRYRVIVQRKLDFSIPSSPDATIEPDWESVGSPISVWTGQTVPLQDLDIERDLPETDLAVSYQIRVSQIQAKFVDGKRIERVVRGGGEDGVHPLELTIPSSHDPDVEVEKRFKIKLL